MPPLNLLKTAMRGQIFKTPSVRIPASRTYRPALASPFQPQQQTTTALAQLQLLHHHSAPVETKHESDHAKPDSGLETQQKTSIEDTQRLIARRVKATNNSMLAFDLRASRKLSRILLEVRAHREADEKARQEEKEAKDREAIIHGVLLGLVFWYLYNNGFFGNANLKVEKGGEEEEEEEKKAKVEGGAMWSGK